METKPVEFRQDQLEFMLQLLQASSFRGEAALRMAMELIGKLREAGAKGPLIDVPPRNVPKRPIPVPASPVETEDIPLPDA